MQSYLDRTRILGQSYKKFQDIQEELKNERNQLTSVYIVCVANSIIAFSYMINWHWWNYSQTINVVLCCVYLMCVVVYLSDNPGKLFEKYKQPFINKTIKGDANSYSEFMRDGNYLRIRYKEGVGYFHIKLDISSIVHDIDSNDLYNGTFSICSLADNEQTYDVPFTNAFTFERVIKQLEDKIKADGGEITAIYHKYTGILWELGDNNKKPSGFKIWFYNTLANWILPVFIFIIFLIPIICVMSEAY